jgi:peptidoglycan/xylan/chitin deacetylase (PgdA/CDA1 family)
VRGWLRDVISQAFFALHRPGVGLRVVFFYHSVGSESPLAEPVEAFRAQVRYVARWFHVVRLAEFLAASAALDRNVACLTFDDGFADNAVTVRDTLEAAGVPGTFFVVTGSLGGDLQMSGGRFRMMDPAQVKALAAAGHEVGAHTVTHPILPGLADEEARREVVDSKQFLEDLLGMAVTSFAYPKGRMDLRVRSFVHDAGYRQAVVTRRAFVEPPVDPLALPRLAVRDYIRMAVGRG